jgi:hypothetical protein
MQVRITFLHLNYLVMVYFEFFSLFWIACGRLHNIISLRLDLEINQSKIYGSESEDSFLSVIEVVEKY